MAIPAKPMPFIDTWLRPRWRLLRRRNRAPGVIACNLCGWVGGTLVRGHHDAERHCPRCKSSNRHRLIAWYLPQAGLLPAGAAVLHVAPEQALAGLLARSAGRYESCDLMRRDVDHRLDLQTDIVAEGAFDLIVINHVLEHVTDDRAVLVNLARMLRPGGACLVTVPMRRDGGPTDEDPTVTAPAERRARFGQDDHLRLYGPDLTDRLDAAGLRASIYVSAQADPDAVERYAMQGETLFIGRHSGQRVGLGGSAA